MSELPILQAMSIQQPHATAITAWGKPVDNRRTLTLHRGPIALHAASNWDQRGARSHMLTNAFARHTTSKAYADAVYRDGFDRADEHLFPHGAIIGVAELVGCHRCTGACSPWAIAGRWHWQLANVVPLPHPIRATGWFGVWPLPADINTAVHTALETAHAAH